MKDRIVVLMRPNETLEQIVSQKEQMFDEGFTLAGIVDPFQAEAVKVYDNVLTIRSPVQAAQICQASSFRYCDTIIHSHALEVLRCRRRVS